MGFNYRQERKKFEEEMYQNEQQYRVAGMSDAQIAAMREYEEEQFRRERIYKIHITLHRSDEYPGNDDFTSTVDLYFQQAAHLDILLDTLSPGLSQKLHIDEKRILLLLSKGLSQRDVAEMLNTSQLTISRRLKKIRYFF